MPFYFINLWLITYRHRYCTYLYYSPHNRYPLLTRTIEITEPFIEITTPKAPSKQLSRPRTMCTYAHNLLHLTASYPIHTHTRSYPRPVSCLHLLSLFCYICLVLSLLFSVSLFVPSSSSALLPSVPAFSPPSPPPPPQHHSPGGLLQR